MDEIRKAKLRSVEESEKTTRRKKETSVNTLLACGKSSGDLIQ